MMHMYNKEKCRVPDVESGKQLILLEEKSLMGQVFEVVYDGEQHNTEKLEIARGFQLWLIGIDRHLSYCAVTPDESTCTTSTALVPDLSFVESDVCAGDEQSWRDGRRVVELGVLADGLSACKTCGVPLILSHTTNFLNYGLGALLKIPCSNTSCKFVNTVPTGKRHDKQVFDMNTKLATGMLHTGIGATEVNSILTSLNIPAVSHAMLDRRQQESGKALEVLAKESTDEWLNNEKRLTSEITREENIAVSVDAGWQKRGSGRAYDSLSGHCSMIGKNTGKVTNYRVRSRSCRVCTIASNNNEPPSDHECRKNWDGTAKAMEQDMIVDMVAECNNRGFKTQTIIADDDSTTIARLRKHIDVNIKKVSDKNHVKKNFNKTLYKLQKTNKNLSTTIIKYIIKCFNYVIAQNSGDPDGMKKSLEALSRHPFGDHSICNASWCRFMSNPNEVFKSLPRGKPISDPKLQQTLTDVLDTYVHQADKLSALGSTQANENFNRIVGSKAPKSKHYSGSASLNYRVAGGVLQKNIGHTYVSLVHRKIGLSPGTHTMRLGILKDLQNRKRKAIATTTKAKRKRLALKAKRIQANTSKEVREGTSYSPSVDTGNIPSDSIEEIPKPHPPPMIETSPFPKKFTPVYFDLETTGLARTSHIIQVAAVSGDETFSTYVMPRIPITPSSSSVTGLTCRNGTLFHECYPVKTVSISEATESFVDFLKKQTPPVFLFGHNIKIFDCPLLMNAIEAVGKAEIFLNCVSGFLDTKLLFKIGMPGLPSYTQTHLFKHITKSEYRAHDAIEDVTALQKLVQDSKLDVSDTCYQSATFSVGYTKENHEYAKRVRSNLPSLKGLIDRKILSKAIARKAAGSGLNYSCLELAYKRNGVDGIRNVFGEKCGMKGIRVTKSSKILDTVGRYFSELQVCANEM